MNFYTSSFNPLFKYLVPACLLDLLANSVIEKIKVFIVKPVINYFNKSILDKIDNFKIFLFILNKLINLIILFFICLNIVILYIHV